MIRWIASYPKSGNTWVRMLLNAYLTGDEFDIQKVPKNFVQDTESVYWHRVSPVPLTHIKTTDEFMLLRNAALLGMALEWEVPVVKTHTANVQLNWYALIPPHITDFAIYVVRDPRDVAVSYADYLGRDIDHVIEVMANDRTALPNDFHPLMIQQTASWSRNVQTWTEDDEIDVLVVRYEDLKADPARELKRIVEKFSAFDEGWAVDDARIEAAVEATEFSKMRAREDEEGFKNRSPYQKKFFREGKAGGWREVLTELQHRRIERDHREMMAKFGYHPGLLKGNQNAARTTHEPVHQEQR